VTVEFLYNEGPQGMLGLGRLNLGDLLCSPESYFRLESNKRTLIIGGGIQSGVITGKKRPPAGYDKVCVWGGGLSTKPNTPLESRLDGIDVWTIRDRECVPDERNWMPCVSCMHPMLDHPAVESQPGRSLLYINADPVIYSPAALLKSRRMAKEAGLDFCTNRAGQKDFFEKWHKCAHVVTNSYHGAYWSLLAGKTVTIFGYNYKFESMISVFSLNSPDITFTKRDRASVIEATRTAILARDLLSLKDAAETRTGFRAMQKAFAKTLCDEGVISDFSEIDHDDLRAQKRAGGSETQRLLMEYAGDVERYVRRRLRAT
jgi:hypothetical protein